MQNWAKACFEKTDFDTHAAVSVVTRNPDFPTTEPDDITISPRWCYL